MIVDDNDEDPATYEEAMMSPDSNKWQEAMKSEMGSMYDNKVWTLVDLPDSRKAVENKWIFKRKQMLMETEEITKWGHEAAGGVAGAAQALAAPTYPWALVWPHALTLRLLKASVAKPPIREPRYGKPYRDAAAASHLGGLGDRLRHLPERGFISRRTLHRHGRLRSDE
ncbi:hypothetical protein QYE76_054584 [Lolium multiflorum]|uniref:Uncharacterized protein n=1 Tax=Lolium multiflorum TaxID=4521 RepID=A0AAD8SYY7_LOLMU|nr:hypothetical protein QYE76_054584 [Lolium multiflorum]